MLGLNDFGIARILYLIGATKPLVAWIAWIFAALGFQKQAICNSNSLTNPTSIKCDATKRCFN
jgi:hypothetical protein